MRKKKISILGVLLAAIIAASFTGCAFTEPPGETTDPSKEYTLQYVDESGTKTIKVKSGDVYSLESIPSKTGHEFLGLFDAAEGGTQYVAANGSALAPFTDNKNMILYPQFRAKDYTLILDYGGAEVTGARSLTVTYGGAVPPLPLNLSLQNNDFQGWYTKQNCQGVQVADVYGIIPTSGKITERLFDITDPDGYLYIYAGFKMQVHTVTFYAKNNAPPEEIQVAHGTHISEVIPTTRVDGKAILSWSTYQNDTDKSHIFNGKVTSDLILYAAEYAPIIEFDADGGSGALAIIEREGEAITLPIPIKTDYVFDGWYAGGDIIELAIMPADSMKLKAKWLPQLLFDARGGESVQNIVQKPGTAITIPITKKDGFIFAGWYNSSDALYESTIMPSESVRLKAMYYEIRKETITIVGLNDELLLETVTGVGTVTTFNPKVVEMNFSNITSVDWTAEQILDIQVHAKVKTHRNGNIIQAYLDFYSANNTSSAYKVGGYTFDNALNETANWKQLDFDLTLPIKSGKLFFAFSAKVQGYSGWFGATLSDTWVEMQIPDMTKLV